MSRNPHTIFRFAWFLLSAFFFIVPNAAHALEAATFSNPKVASAYSVVRNSINARQSKIPNLTATEANRILAAEKALSKAFEGVDSAFALSDAQKASAIRQLSRSYSNLSKLLSTLSVSKKTNPATVSPVPTSWSAVQLVSDGTATQDLGTSADVTYYADSFEGRGTAGGERFSQGIHSAARCSVAFGKILQVSFGGKSLMVKANDRPNCSKYPNVVDLSSSAFTALAPLSKWRLSGFVAELWNAPEGYLKEFFSQTAFSSLGVELSGNLPNTYLPGETLRVLGRVTDGKKDSVLFFKTPSGQKISRSYPVASDGTFRYEYPLVEPGRYEMVVASGMGFTTTKTQSFFVLSDSVLEGKRTQVSISPEFVLRSPEFERLEGSDLSPVNLLRLPESREPLLRTVRISQAGTETLVRRSMGNVAFLPSDVTRFDSSKPVRMTVSVSKASTAFSMDAYSEEFRAYDQELPLVPSYVTERKEAVSATVEGSALRINAFPATGRTALKGEAYVILPSGAVEVKKFPQTSLDPSWHVKAGAPSVLESPLTQKGQYLVEVMYANGFPAYNAPIVFWTPVAALLANEYDAANKDSANDLSMIPSDALRYVNALRSKIGKDPLLSDPMLAKLAQAKAEDMAANNYVGHDDSHGEKIVGTAKRVGIPVTGGVGENVAGGSVSAEFLLAGLTLSGGHRANMLGNWKRMGVGAVVKDGLTYYVQVFGE